MKKIIALALALVLALGLATVAFAETTKLDFDQNDPAADYHKAPGISEATAKVPLSKSGSICYDGGKAVATLFQVYGQLDKNEKPIAIKYADAAKYFELKVTKGATLGTIALEYEKVVVDDVEYVAAVNLAITPKDNAVAVNDIIAGVVSYVDKVAYSLDFDSICEFEVELCNHYINQTVSNAKDVVNNALGLEYNSQDLAIALKNNNKELHLVAHYNENDSKTPAYVVYSKQFMEISAKSEINFVWDNLATITLSNVGAQVNGLNFKVLVSGYEFTRAQLNANANSKGVYVSFPCAATLDVAGEIKFDKEFLKGKLGYTAADKEQIVYIYTSEDGKTYSLAAKGDLAAKDAEVVVELKAGDDLGYYLFTNVELEASGKAPEKSNTATGASEMVSVCVALAVVSLVAAGAVTVKKISK